MESRRVTVAADAWRTAALRGPAGPGGRDAPAAQAQLPAGAWSPTRNSLEQTDTSLPGWCDASGRSRAEVGGTVQSRAASAW